MGERDSDSVYICQGCTEQPVYSHRRLNILLCDREFLCRDTSAHRKMNYSSFIISNVFHCAPNLFGVPKLFNLKRTHEPKRSAWRPVCVRVVGKETKASDENESSNLLKPA